MAGILRGTGALASDAERLVYPDWNHPSWREYLATQCSADENDAIRESTHTGRPLGTPEFVKALEKTMQRGLASKKGGRRETSREDCNQSELDF